MEQLEKVQAVRHQLPALEAVIVMDGPAAAQSAVGAVASTPSRERGHARMMAEWGVCA